MRPSRVGSLRPAQRPLQRSPAGPSPLLRREGLTMSLLLRGSRRLRGRWRFDAARACDTPRSSTHPPCRRSTGMTAATACRSGATAVGHLAERSVRGVPTRVRGESARRRRASARLSVRESARDPSVQRSGVAVRVLSGAPRASRSEMPGRPALELRFEGLVRSKIPACRRGTRGHRDTGRSAMDQ